MRALSSLAILLAVLYSANAFNTWCCYDYVHSLAGWLRVFTTPASRATATKICAAEGAKLATAEEDKFKDEMVKIAKTENLALYGGIILVPYKATVFDQHRALKPDGSFVEINEDEKYPFVCFREVKDFETNSCGLVKLGYEANSQTNSCYKFHTELYVWNKANDTCNDEGAHLAVINSAIEAQVIKELFAKFPEQKIPVPSNLKVGDYLRDYAFLGVEKVGNDWMTKDGKTIKEAGYDKFAPGEPNNSRGDENYLAVSPQGLLVDDPGTRNKPFICERQQNVSLCHNMKEKAKCNAGPLPKV